MATTLGCQFRESTKKIQDTQDPELLSIHQRHQKVIEARATLHATAGVDFHKRFCRFKDHGDEYSKPLNLNSFCQ